MKRTAAVVAIICALAAGAASALDQVRFIGNMATHFSERPTAGEAIDAYVDADRPFFYGPGWEVVLDHVGFGGNYMVRFFKDSLDRWFVDWVVEGLYLSYHVVGAGHMVDPFVQIGLGSAGRAISEAHSPDVDSPVAISIFPMVATGLAFDLNGFLFGGRLSYIPELTPPPGTNYDNYPLERFQVAFYGGIALGDRPPHLAHQGRRR